MSNNWDIICIGAGSTGLPLAIKAAERGASLVCLPEHFSYHDHQVTVAGTHHKSYT